jgi:arabinan endo-1,5-alpha-L-arabinosidase
VKRREFLKGGLLGISALAGSQLFASAISGQRSQPGQGTLRLEGAILNVHDPVVIKQDDSYYLFSTGVGIPVRRSPDLQTWRVARGGTVFQRMPEEASAYVPGADNIWAPDISFYNGRYHLYYSVSTFGSNRSAIGLATNKTLLHYLPAQDYQRRHADGYGWALGG